MATVAAERALPYAEPSIVTVLVLASFLLVLNAANAILDATVYCGLVGELVVGVLWGTPLGGWLARGVETAVVQLGYLGLILLVYEGGLNTSLGPLLTNLPRSAAVALTGIGSPIGLSFVLGPLASASLLQCFAAGAALSATSLGTTFTILSSAGFANTRLGTVLTSAAMIDDVIGMVLIQVISSLGGSSGSSSSTGGGSVGGDAVGRPIGASVGLLVATVAACFLAKKIFANTRSYSCMARPEARFVVHTIVLIALVVVASYAGASALFAAFLAGTAVSWWDTILSKALEVEIEVEVESESGTESGTTAAPRASSHQTENAPSHQNSIPGCTVPPSGVLVFERYYGQPLEKILKPFFFASIGFSIPITEMFKGSIVWRGMVYSVLMILGKLLTGVWLIRFPSFSSSLLTMTKPMRSFLHKLTHMKTLILRIFWTPAAAYPPKPPTKTEPKTTRPEAVDPTNVDQPSTPAPPAPQPAPGSPTPSSSPTPETTSPQQRAPQQPPPKPRSLYPPVILGLAMVARREVAFLIASVAESRGIFASSDQDQGGELYLIIVWAAVLCTMLGPLGVGMLVRRLKALEEKRKKNGGGGSTGVLGEWGVETLTAM